MNQIIRQILKKYPSRHKTYLVGGYIRDFFLFAPSKDYDVAILCENFEDAVEEFESLGGRIYKANSKFLTFRGNFPDIGPLDVKVCRVEGPYSDGRHPDYVTPATSIEEDLKFRDFTINAIAYDLKADKIIDPHGGIEDIKKKIIRPVGNVIERINEDSLRILRALRIYVTKNFKAFNCDLDSCFSEKEIVNKLHNVSVERVYEELNKMYKHDPILSTQLLFKTYPYVGQVVFGEMGVGLVPSLKK